MQPSSSSSSRYSCLCVCYSVDMARNHANEFIEINEISARKFHAIIPVVRWRDRANDCTLLLHRREHDLHLLLLFFFSLFLVFCFSLMFLESVAPSTYLCTIGVRQKYKLDVYYFAADGYVQRSPAWSNRISHTNYPIDFVWNGFECTTDLRAINQCTSCNAIPFGQTDTLKISIKTKNVVLRGFTRSEFI